MKKLVVLGLVIMLVLSFSSMAFAGEQDFTLVTDTGVDIHYVYVSPHGSDDWGADVMGKDILPDDSSVDITFSPGESAANWDIRVEDKAGNYLEWTNFNLKEITTITLKPNGDAEFQ